MRGSLSRMKTDGRADGRTKFLYESHEKTSLRSILIILTSIPPSGGEKPIADNDSVERKRGDTER